MSIQQKLFWMLIPAAGTGSRFKSAESVSAEVPKQYQKLTPQKSLLQYTVEQVIQHPRIAGLILALHPEDQYFAGLGFATKKSIYHVTGGSSRTLSVLYALDFACQNKLVRAEDWVLIHDIARPLVSQQEISQLIDAIHNHDAVYQGISLGLPMHDSVKRIADTEQTTTIKTATQTTVQNTVQTIVRSEPREQLWRSITPQAARAGTLLSALKEHRHDATITDEMSALALVQAPCALIPGNSRNMKITTVEDLALVKLYSHDEQTRL